MVASYLGGCAIGFSYVGIIHPFSAGLSVVLGTHHCVSNCITMRAMEEFYLKNTMSFGQWLRTGNSYLKDYVEILARNNIIPF